MTQTTPKQGPDAPRLTPGVFSSRSDEWYTPKPLVEALAKRYTGGRGFALDVAATRQSRVCPAYYDITRDALTQDWHRDACGGVAWMNPPYSLARQFLAKAAETARAGTPVVGLLPSRTETGWFHDLMLPVAAEVWFIKSRVKFRSPDEIAAEEGKVGAAFPSVVFLLDGTARFPRFGTMDTKGTVLLESDMGLEVAS